MASVGEILRRERERQGLSIAQIAQQTRIKRQFLESLEKDDFANLPGIFFVRAFTVQYGQFLGLKAEELQMALERQVSSTDVNLAPVATTPFLGADRGLSKPALDPLPEGTASAMSARKLTASVVALAAVIIGCGTVFWLWQRSQLGSTSANADPQAVTVIKGASQQPIAPPPVQPSNPLAKAESTSVAPAGNDPQATVQPASPQSTTPAAAQPAAAQPATGQTAIGQTASAAAQPATTTPAATMTPAQQVPGKLNVSIASKEDTWVRITTDGKVILARVISPGEPLVTAVANENAKVLIGNAGGVSIRFNGNDIGVVGPRGQVRTVEFTPAGFNVLLPPPKVPPADGAAAPKPPNTGD